jgi:hypothetical protein
MLRRLIQWFKNLWRSLFGGKSTPSHKGDNISATPPPLTDTDLEMLFTQLLEGVYQARGEDWAQKWLDNIKHRVPTERWVEWLRRFSDRLLASPTPNNELAARLVKLGEMRIGVVGDVALEIGMKLLTRNQGEPVWEYDGPDAVTTPSPPPDAQPENPPSDDTTQTVTLDQLFVMMQQDEKLRQQIAQQLGVESENPEEIIQVLINQYHASNPQS